MYITLCALHSCAVGLYMYMYSRTECVVTCVQAAEEGADKVKARWIDERHIIAHFKLGLVLQHGGDALGFLVQRHTRHHLLWLALSTHDRNNHDVLVASCGCDCSIYC